jgi:hypothetical protein
MYVQDKAHELRQSGLGLFKDVFEADYVDWYFRFKPEFMEVLPDSDLLLNELSPMVAELNIVLG